MKYVLTNHRETSAVVEGLGVLPPRSQRTFDQGAVDMFKHLRGLALANALPEGVELEILVEKEG